MQRSAVDGASATEPLPPSRCCSWPCAPRARRASPPPLSKRTSQPPRGCAGGVGAAGRLRAGSIVGDEEEEEEEELGDVPLLPLLESLPCPPSTAAKEAFSAEEGLLYEQLSGLCRDAAWTKSYIASSLLMAKELFQVGVRACVCVRVRACVCVCVCVCVSVCVATGHPERAGVSHCGEGS